mmetsp:Transcript_6122/g.20406  ORF Transcript_6122/g.20406 Transcript_6122/m.20406 type:complete len:85 (-) Transcript_6122:1035-1289(-)
MPSNEGKRFDQCSLLILIVCERSQPHTEGSDSRDYLRCAKSACEHLDSKTPILMLNNKKTRQLLRFSRIYSQNSMLWRKVKFDC